MNKNYKIIGFNSYCSDHCSNTDYNNKNTECIRKCELVLINFFKIIENHTTKPNINLIKISEVILES